MDIRHSALGIGIRHWVLGIGDGLDGIHPRNLCNPRLVSGVKEFFKVEEYYWSSVTCSNFTNVSQGMGAGFFPAESYSYFSAFAGSRFADCQLFKPTVNMAVTKQNTPAPANIQILNGIR